MPRLTHRLAGLLATCAASLLLPACGGGTDGEEGKLYVGYYLEDPVNNPEDPEPGTLVAYLPAGDGNFQGLMPFSYAGCRDGIDVGVINGTRRGNTLDGQWAGSVDGVPVGGDYDGSYDALADQFSGTYTNSAGKVPVTGPGDCSYHVAAYGSWRLYGGTVATPSNFIAGSTGGTSPTWSWPSLGGTVFYLVRVLDEGCLLAGVANGNCLVGEGQTLLTRIAYPAEFDGASPLTAGRRYIVAVHAIDASTWQQVGFTTRLDRP